MRVKYYNNILHYVFFQRPIGCAAEIKRKRRIIVVPLTVGRIRVIGYNRNRAAFPPFLGLHYVSQESRVVRSDQKTSTMRDKRTYYYFYYRHDQ